MPTTIVPSETQAIPGQPTATLIDLNPATDIFANNPAPFTGVVTSIQQAIADDALANTPGTTPLPAPDNFKFTDFTVNVSSTTPGDVFKGTADTDVKAQFLDLTPDNMGITALGPNVFMRTDTGNDVLQALSGHNIMDAGSGSNTFIGGSGRDAMISNASKANAESTILNFGSGDDAVITGVNLADFTVTLTDLTGGLLIDAVHIPGQPGQTFPSAEMFLPGFKTADIGSKISLGFVGTTNTPDAQSFLFVHAT